jgi:tetratricopeptide (TPR) repeat protein
MRSWPAFGLTRGQGLVLAASAVTFAALGFLPLFGGPGYESALALGVLLPLPLAIVSARLSGPAPNGSIPEPFRSPWAALSGSVRFAFIVLTLQLGLLLLHGLRAGFCDPVQGLVLFALGPAAGALMAAAWGTVAGLVGGHFPRRGRAVALWLAALGPLGGILLSVWRFWSSPMVFAFDPFAGFFAGTLYDTVIDAVPRLLTYRAGSAGTLLCVVCVCAALGRSVSGRLDLSAARQRIGRSMLAVCGAILSTSIYFWGSELGHYQSTKTIAAALGERWASERCDIVYGSGIRPERAKLLGEECDAHIARHEAFFETEMRERVTVFTFLSAQQKGALMGASNTYIAKPWRREIYIQSDNYPHPVLSHELAHVVAGAFARGPLKVAGPLGGWIPDPGRIEGFAVAAAPSEDTDHTLLEWTKALKDLELLPPVRAIFRLSFLGQNSSTAYTVAGAFVGWLRAKQGPLALRSWYAGASVEAAFGGKTLSALEQEFHADLDRVQLPEAVLELARARFDRPAIFGRRCPHVVDRLLQDASAAFERFDLEKADRDYKQSLRLDPNNFSARMGLAACDQRRGAAEDAASRYDTLATDESLTRVERALVRERMGDRALYRGELSEAFRLYTEAESYAFDEHRARAIAVKRYAIEDQEGRQAIVDLLIGAPELGSDFVQSSAALGEWTARNPELGLADYLIGKNLYSRGRWRDASAYLQRALQRRLPLDSVRREALRSSVFAGCALGDRLNASAAFRAYVAEAGLSLARKNGMQRFAQLCRLPEAQ